MTVVLCVACYVFFAYAIRWIEVKDGVALLEGYLSIRMMGGAVLVCLLSLYRYQGLVAVCLTFFLLYLLTSAYIDGKTMYVYSFLNRIALWVGLTLHVVNVVMHGLPNRARLLEVIFYILFIYLQVKGKGFAEGDGGVFLITTVYLSYFFIEANLLPIFLLQSFLSVFLFLVTNLPYLELRRWKMKKKIAFVPSIFLANLMLFVLI